MPFDKLLGAIALVLMAAGCAHTVGAASACVDHSTQTLHLDLTNSKDVSISVPEGSPHIGCCNASGLALAVTDAHGREMDRCASSDNFEAPLMVELSPGRRVRYELSEISMRQIYCKIDLTKHFFSVSYGVSGGKPDLLTQKAIPIELCTKRRGD